MTKTEIFALLVFATLTFLPVLASAESPSYTAKKQGRVAFQRQDDAAAQPAASEQTPSTQETTPEEVEPAAGAQDEAQTEDASKNSLAEQIKLPRKN